MRASGIDSIPRQSNGGPYTYSGTRGFIEALGFEVVVGRSFDETEYLVGGAPVVMVSELFAGVIWPDRNPLNECVLPQDGSTGLDGPEPCRPVVGVYRDLAVRSVADDAPLSVAWPSPPAASARNGIVLRAQNDPSELVSVIRWRVLELSSDVRFVHIEPISDRVDRMVAPWRLGATMFTAFGVLALLLAAVGLYSTLAFTVAERRREIGIRAALGAARGDLVRMVTARAARIVAAGLAIGGAVALLGGRFLDDVLFGVTATDPLVYGWVFGTLAFAAALAATLPAVRATSISPVTAIRSE